MIDSKPHKSALVVDLDNTLFNWFELWYGSFKPMYDEILRISGLAENELKRRIRRVFQQFHTSEYSLLIRELQLGREGETTAAVEARYREAIDAFRAGREKHRHLYPGVLETLRAVRGAGALIIGFTESHAFYTTQRLIKMGLDGMLDVVYMPSERLPESVNFDLVRGKAKEDYELQRTRPRELAFRTTKPNPQVLLDILAENGVSIDQAVYVGDSMMKDIQMAQDAGVLDVWAEYGDHRDPDAYRLLQEVSHWSEEDVRREQEIKIAYRERASEIHPTLTLDVSFAQLLEKVGFLRFESRSRDR